MGELNRNIFASGSQASVSDLEVSYNIHLQPIADHTSIDYTVVLDGTISNYLITQDSQKALIDMGWRGFSAYGEVIIDGVEINTPISILASHSPETYELLAGTAADDVLLRQLINADFILEQPMTNWHFLFDPTGINVDAGTFGLSDEIAGHVVSAWTMGESSLREGIQTEREFEAVVTLDREYTIRSLQSADNAVVRVIGFGTLDVLDGVEIVGVTPTPPGRLHHHIHWRLSNIHHIRHGRTCSRCRNWILLCKQQISQEAIHRAAGDRSQPLGGVPDQLVIRWLSDQPGRGATERRHRLSADQKRL